MSSWYRPGFEDEHQLYAFQLVTGVLAYSYIDRIKLWDKFSANRLFPRCSVGANLLFMASAEYGTMAGFSIWLSKKTFPGTSFWNVLSYVHSSLQITKATAEAINKNVNRELGLISGAAIALICHFTVICAVTVIIPKFPLMLEWLGLIGQLWAYVAIVFTVRHRFV